MKRSICGIVLALFSAASFAAGTSKPVDPVYVNLSDTASLQRGAALFVTYCLSCHSAAYMRYNRMGKDLEISDAVLKENFMFAADKIGELMETSMAAEDAKRWFGVAPPDLTLEARLRKPAWIYTYLRSFYKDEGTVSGWNNTLFENVAMPHVLYDLQGTQRLVGVNDQGRPEFQLVKEGLMTPDEYDGAIRDLINFMVYLAEPAALSRQTVGVFVIAFLIVLLICAYLLKKEYWRDVH
jgi:ubiquinol-cytochrome c reductase cytochrome c1 subunit